MNVDPLSSPSLFTVKVPLWASTMTRLYTINPRMKLEIATKSTNNENRFT